MNFTTVCVFIFLICPTLASAQMASNGGTTQPANTSAFGQSAPFSNATTTFDGVTFNLTRLIIDPTEGSMYRMVGTLTKMDSGDAEVLFFAPAPVLLDELGNKLDVSTSTGIEACLSRGSWSSDRRDCDDLHNSQRASRLAKDVTIPFSIGFVPSAKDYSAELAELSNTVTARVHFIYSLDDFQSMKIAEVIVPNIPLPR